MQENEILAAEKTEQNQSIQPPEQTIEKSEQTQSIQPAEQSQSIPGIPITELVGSELVPSIDEYLKKYYRPEEIQCCKTGSKEDLVAVFYPWVFALGWAQLPLLPGIYLSQYTKPKIYTRKVYLETVCRKINFATIYSALFLFCGGFLFAPLRGYQCYEINSEGGIFIEDKDLQAYKNNPEYKRLHQEPSLVVPILVVLGLVGVVIGWLAMMEDNHSSQAPPDPFRQCQLVEQHKEKNSNEQVTLPVAASTKNIAEVTKENGQDTLPSHANDKPPAESKNQKSNTQPTLTFGDGIKYVGEVKDGKMHGRGTLTSQDGWQYVGEFKDNSMHGTGTFTTSEGGKYVGEFKDDSMHGTGTLTYPNGNQYVGEFKDDSMHGAGTLTFSNGSKYVGEFQDGNMHGTGTLTLPDGTQYAGRWENGQFMDP